jgi:hypothetical protein
MAAPFTNTGKSINSQLKVQAFFFDCSDPSINFIDGVYDTDIVLKNNALIWYSAIKYQQDLSAYPAITITVLTGTTGNNGILYQRTLPIVQTPNNYLRSVSGTVGVPGPGNQANSPQIGSAINNNNVGVGVGFTGMTASGITALSFTFVIMYVELDV